MRTENPSIHVESSDSSVKRQRAGNRYIAQLCGYMEDRTQDAARKLHAAALSATTGWLGVTPRPGNVAKHRPWQGVATMAAVSVWVGGSTSSKVGG